MIAIGLEFVGLALVVIIAGTFLARAADAVAEITRLGRVLIGSVLLAGVTSLPELTVDVSAVRQGHADLAFGDLFGSSLMNLLILASLDLLHRSGGKFLSREAAAHALSATLSIALTALAGAAILVAGRIPSYSFLGIGLWSWSILAAYLLGVRMVFIDQRISARAAAEAAEAEAKPGSEPTVQASLTRAMATFAAAAAVLFFAGPRLAEAASQLADKTGLGTTFVGTTLVALCTSLPELVASISALRIGAVDLAIGNVFGSNAFNMVLFVPLDAVHEGPLFAAVAPTHAITCLAVIVATSIGVLGQLYRVERRWPIVEPDALLMMFVTFGGMFLVYWLSN